MEEGGFEPPKRDATDLQSAPFGHSGTPPYGAGERTKPLARLHGLQHNCRAKTLSGFESVSETHLIYKYEEFTFLGTCSGAGERTRTPDLLITNQLLYQLSYTSTLCVLPETSDIILHEK